MGKALSGPLIILRLTLRCNSLRILHVRTSTPPSAGKPSLYVITPPSGPGPARRQWLACFRLVAMLGFVAPF